jgi:hypothetical protein
MSHMSRSIQPIPVRTRSLKQYRKHSQLFRRQKHVAGVINTINTKVLVNMNNWISVMSIQHTWLSDIKRVSQKYQKHKTIRNTHSSPSNVTIHSHENCKAWKTFVLKNCLLMQLTKMLETKIHTAYKNCTPTPAHHFNSRAYQSHRKQHRIFSSVLN